MIGNEIYVEAQIKELKKTTCGYYKEEIKIKRYYKVKEVKYIGGWIEITFFECLKNGDLTETKECYKTSDIVNLKVLGN